MPGQDDVSTSAPQQTVRPPAAKRLKLHKRGVSGGSLPPGHFAREMACVRRPQQPRRHSAPSAGFGPGPSRTRGELAGGFDIFTQNNELPIDPPTTPGTRPVKRARRPGTQHALGPMETAVTRAEALYQPHTVNHNINVMTRRGFGVGKPSCITDYRPAAPPPAFFAPSRSPPHLPTIAEEQFSDADNNDDGGNTGEDSAPLASPPITAAAPTTSAIQCELWDIDEEDWDYAAEDVLDVDGEAKDTGPATGRKYYMTSDDPMSVFRLLCPTILNSFFDLHAAPLHADCRSCAFRRATAGQPALASRPRDLFRCTSCGVFLECRSCCLQRHQQTPLHRIQRWNDRDGFFRNISLRELGQTYQLGHAGLGCHAATDCVEALVLHTNGIHRVSIQWCECDRGDGDSYWRQAMRMGWFPGSWSR